MDQPRKFARLPPVILRRHVIQRIFDHIQQRFFGGTRCNGRLDPRGQIRLGGKDNFLLGREIVKQAAA